MRRARLDRAARRALEAWVGAPPVAPSRQLRRPVETRQGLISRLDRLEAAYGRHGAAEAIGVKVARIRDWRRGITPLAVNQQRIDQAHEQLLAKQGDTTARRRAELKRRARLGGNGDLVVRVTSELQVDGYYNGQADTVAPDYPSPPNPDNQQAHRQVNFGAHPADPILTTYAEGGSLGVLLEVIAQGVISNHTFANDYYRAPSAAFKTPGA